MAIRTANKYGKIVITDLAISTIASNAAVECYGVMELSMVTLTDRIARLFNKPIIGKGVKVEIIDNKVNIDVYVKLKNGVNLETVTKSLRDSIEYSIEKFTNMRVNKVNVHITGLSLE